MGLSNTKILIHPNATIKDAMRQMDEASQKILFVVESDQKLVGVLTDGDLRREILKSASIDIPIANCINRSPSCLKVGFTEDEAKRIMLDRSVESVPVVDAHGTVQDIVNWKQLFNEKFTHKRADLETPVVIMAGGKGTRLEPFTNILPKPLIPIGEKPVLQVILEKFQAGGLNDFHIIVNYKGEMIKSYFDSIDDRFKITYVWEKEFLGTGGGLRLLPDNVASTFIVSNCDVLISADFRDLIHFHKENKNLITIVGTFQHHIVPYGVIHFGSNGSIVKLTEKPEYDFTVNTGCYVLEKSVLEKIPKDSHFHITDLINLLLENGENVGVYPTSEKSYIDIGQWDAYRKSLRQLFDNRQF